jgi:hypothetical protein
MDPEPELVDGTMLDQLARQLATADEQQVSFELSSARRGR